jgi:hypothetical protein
LTSSGCACSSAAHPRWVDSELYPAGFPVPARRRYPPHDVVFYRPWIATMVLGQSTSPSGGAETQVLALAKELVRHRLRVAIIVFGSACALPEQVAGVRIISRPAFTKSKGVIGKLVEAGRIWRSLRVASWTGRWRR